MNYEMYRNVKHRQSPARSKRNHFHAAGAARSADKKRKAKLVEDSKTAEAYRKAAKSAGTAAARALQAELMKSAILTNEEIEEIAVQNGVAAYEAVMETIKGA